MIDYSVYQSPFSWRYGSTVMREVWSELYTRQVWRSLWYYLARAELSYGLISDPEFMDISNHLHDIDIEKSHEYEKITKHDLVAELKVFQEQCKIGGSKIHLGATSMDLKDNAEILQIKKSLDLIITKLTNLLYLFSHKIIANKDVMCIGYTHLQAAEETTVGYRLASYAQDLLSSFIEIQDIFDNLKIKGFRGAVGTASSFISLLGDKYRDFEDELERSIGMQSYDVVNQTYPRQLDYKLTSALAGLCGVLSRFAFDIRILQSSPFSEVQESFSEKQVGSSAMAWKKNPVSCEKVCSLAREISVFPQVAWNNASQSLLERTLDDSANRRSIIPESFLITDEILETCINILTGMKFDYKNISLNLEKYGRYSCIENLMNAAIVAGANRQEIYEDLQKNFLDSKLLSKYLTAYQIEEILSQDNTGIASEQALKMANLILDSIKE
jgi:adenylosuccinate lyase